MKLEKKESAKKALAMTMAVASAVFLVACGSGSSTVSTTAAATTEAVSAADTAGESEAEETFAADSASAVDTSNAEYVMKVGYGTASGHPIDLGSIQMKELIEERSGGRIEVQLYPSAQLGSERQMIEGLMAGTIECTPTTTGPMSNFLPEYGLFDLPYLFRDNDHVYSFLDGEYGTKLLNDLEDLGLVGAAWWENGWRQFANSKRTVRVPEDVKGMKVRTMENDVHIDFWNSLGGTSCPMGFGEIYMAAKNGTVDADDNPISIYTVNNFFDVFKYFTVDNYVYSPVVVLFSKQWFDELPEDLQQICLDAAYEVRTYERQVGSDMNEEYLKTCAENGVEITYLEEDELAQWQEVAAPFMDKYGEIIGEDLVEAAINYQP